MWFNVAMVLIIMKREYFQTIRKRYFAELLSNFVSAGCLDFLRPFPVGRHR